MKARVIAVVFGLVVTLLVAAPGATAATLIEDDFNGASLDSGWNVFYAGGNTLAGNNWVPGWWSSNPDTYTQTLGGSKFTVSDLVVNPPPPTTAQASGAGLSEWDYTDYHNLMMVRQLNTDGHYEYGPLTATVKFSWDQKGLGQTVMQGFHFALGDFPGGYWDGFARMEYYDGWNAENKYWLKAYANAGGTVDTITGDHDTGSMEFTIARDGASVWHAYINGVELALGPGATGGHGMKDLRLWFEGMDYSSTSLGATPFGGISVDYVKVADEFMPPAIPEPSTAVLILLGGGGLLFLRRRYGSR